MKPFTRKRLGATILVISLASGFIMYLCGLPLYRWESTGSLGGGRDGYGTTTLRVYWPAMLLPLSGMTGATLMLIPNRKETNG